MNAGLHCGANGLIIVWYCMVVFPAMNAGLHCGGPATDAVVGTFGCSRR